MASARRLLPGTDSKADANDFIGLIAVGSAVAWALTYATVVLAPPSGNGPIAPKTGAWGITAVWLVACVLALAVGYYRVDHGVLFSTPMLAWTGLVAVGFVLSSYGTAVGAETVVAGVDGIALMWGAWYGVLALGYLVTAVTVTRPAVYYAGAVLTVLATAVVFGVLSRGARPHSLVLGVLGVVPPLVDAYQGGRQLNEDGVPAVEAERLDDDAGGVVEV